MTQSPTNPGRPRVAQSRLLRGGVALAVVVGVFFVGRWSVPLDQRPGFAPPALVPTVVSPRIGELSSVIPATGQVQYRALTTTQLQAPPDDFRRVVTAAPLGVGDRVELGALLGSVNDVPAFALQGATPSFRVMRLGDRGTDIGQLTASLEKLGYLSSAPETMTREALSATAEFLADRGFPSTPDALADDGVDGRMFAFLERLPATVVSTDLVQGAAPGADGASITLGEGDAQLVVAALHPGQDLPEGSAVSATCSGARFEGTLSGVVAVWHGSADGISDEGSAAPATGALVDTEADLAEAVGATCAVTVTVLHGEDATVSVPVAAVFSTGDGSTELRVQTEGAEFTTLAVRTGEAADGWVPILDPPPSLTAEIRLLTGIG